MRKADPLARSVVEAAVELHRRRLWRATPGDAPFLVRLPGETSPLVASIMGQMGAEYGLSLARGESAFSLSVLMHGSNRDPPEEVDAMSLLAVTMEPIASVPRDALEFLKGAAFQVGHDGIAPLFLAKPPHRVPRPPNRSELRLLLGAMHAVLAAHSVGEFRPIELNARKRRVFEITVATEGRDAAPQTAVVPWPKSPLPRPVEPVKILRGVDATLPRLDERWLVSWQMFPIAIEADGRPIAVLLVVEETSGRVLTGDPIPAGDFDEAAESIARVLRGEAEDRGPGLPREIAFASADLEAALNEPLARIGVAVARVDEHPALDAALDSLESTFSQIGDELRAAVPLPTTLDEWKDANQHFIGRMAEEVIGSASERRGLARYFGSVDDALEIVADLARFNPSAAFLEWFVAEFRSTRRSRTFLERRLARKRLSRIERALIEARRNARVSIFRVDKAEAGATFDVEDILSGERLTVLDRALSGCNIEGLFLPLRLLRLGEWNTCVVAGPPLDAIRIDRVLHQLEGLGVELSHEGLRRWGHVLWRWEYEDARRPPTLCNTDGEPLDFVTATFRVRDVAALQVALRAQPDVEYDESDDTWVWSRPGGPSPGSGKMTLLAQLTILGETLVVEVNSRGRLARARAWIDRLCGVAFERATSKLISSEAALDDRLEPAAPEAPIAKELLAHIEAAQRENCRQWLDKPVPALWNLTPRAACASEEGRRRVAIMIRCWPDSRVPGGRLPAPRAEMLRELRLEPHGQRGSAAVGA